MLLFYYMKRFKFFLLFILVIFLFSGAACVQVKPVGIDGGVFKSINRGESWQQKVDLLSINAPQKIAYVNANFLTFDPHDSSILYLGSKQSGLFISYDSGESWQVVSRLPRATINAIAVDPKARNIVYVAIGNRIFKSTDCCYNWQSVYLEGAADVSITALTVDPFETNRVYAGLSDGRLLMSVNGGLSWGEGFKAFPRSIRWILIHPKTNVFFVGTVGGGFWRSKDRGENWEDISQKLQNFPGANEVESLIFDLTKDNSLVILTPYGLLRSDNGGDVWSDYKLLIQPGRVKILSFDFNRRNPNEIYYVTSSTFYRSTDGGKRWQTKPLPSRRLPATILVDPNNPNVLFLAVYKPEQ
jgi:photosystem II stability/assembly factor-like uncharacterized protein